MSDHVDDLRVAFEALGLRTHDIDADSCSIGIYWPPMPHRRRRAFTSGWKRPRPSKGWRCHIRREKAARRR